MSDRVWAIRREGIGATCESMSMSMSMKCSDLVMLASVFSVLSVRGGLVWLL